MRITGAMGVMAEGYRASGIASRRPGNSQRVYARAAADAYGFRYGLDLLLSTEESRFRQQFNRAQLRVERSWFAVAAGDNLPRFSSYGLAGTSVRGGLIELDPGPMSLTVVGGRARRAVETPVERMLTRASFEQWLWGAHARYQAAGGSFVGLSFHTARDRPTSLDEATTLQPQENAVVTPEFSLALPGIPISLRGEVSVSAFTEDTRSPRSESPTALPDVLFRGRSGSRTDYATKLSGAYAGDGPVSFELDYDRVGTGYRSLGLAQLRSDLETISVNPGLRFRDRKISMDVRYQRRRNNLEGIQFSTSTWSTIGANVRAQVNDWFSMAGSFRNNESRNEPTASAPSDAVRATQTGRMVALSPTFSLKQGETRHEVSTALSRQTQQAAGAGAFEIVFGTLAYSAILSSGITLNATLNGASTTSDLVDAGTVGVSIGASRGFLQQRLFVSGTLGRTSTTATPRNQVESATHQLTATLSGSYRLPFGDTINVQMRGLRSARDGGESFREFQTTLRYEHRF